MSKQASERANERENKREFALFSYTEKNSIQFKTTCRLLILFIIIRMFIGIYLSIITIITSKFFGFKNRRDAK